jgi:hypothetical protein
MTGNLYIRFQMFYEYDNIKKMLVIGCSTMRMRGFINSDLDRFILLYPRCWVRVPLILMILARTLFSLFGRSPEVDAGNI